ncbi:hypothetical protein [Pseudophaeobacter leonis]|uniref:hypothetical protein n=1 Tax=Pseudophaeobacter leonis TaxID=1144477 RepID=UPI001374827F|nr:hypothetical protein [Pseudophaeobacter leonis]
MKKQLSNVAFGGSWSEEILNTSELLDALDVIAQAADDCVERDVRSAALEAALTRIQAKVGKGTELCDQFRRAIAEPNHGLRMQNAQQAARRLRLWCGPGS